MTLVKHSAELTSVRSASRRSRTLCKAQQYENLDQKSPVRNCVCKDEIDISNLFTCRKKAAKNQGIILHVRKKSEEVIR